MENTALNGTTATKDQEDWKKKKGSGRIVAASLALLLGLSFYAGRQASSSSVSLVGSGTAASDLKTLALAIDDDEVIDGLLFEMPWLRKEKPKKRSYAIGVPYPLFMHPKGGEGNAGDKCKKTSDCKIPDGLNHAVCRKGKCQRGVCRDYCGQDSDCISGLQCRGDTGVAKCMHPHAINCY